MRRSELFVKTRRQAPADETAKNAQLLIRAGFVHKEMAGVYSYLPFGQMVIDKITRIVRHEMNKIGGVEMRLSSLQDKQIWQATDRWQAEKVDVWFKTALQSGSDLGLAWSHEEPMARLMNQFVSSYKDLPVYTYQFQTKLRNELRAKNGLLRAREFVMKDLYSFCRDEKQHQEFYDQISGAYMEIYKQLGISDITYKTFASGGPFSKFSHEFQTLSGAGEDTVYLDEAKDMAVNQEVLTDEVLADLKLNREELSQKKAVEVGNIFTFGSRYSEPLGLMFTDEHGSQKPVFMGSYGIGISRLMGLLAEHFADDKGLAWPEAIAPFSIYLARLGDSQEVIASADKAYRHLTEANVRVLYDDRRDVSAGEMFADADLIGLPLRLVVSDKTVASNSYELKNRKQEQTREIPAEQLVEVLVKEASN
jgi:prolyl-tRNA synthetase